MTVKILHTLNDIKLQISSLQQQALNLQTEVLKSNAKIGLLAENTSPSCATDNAKDTTPPGKTSSVILGNSVAPDLSQKVVYRKTARLERRTTKRIKRKKPIVAEKNKRKSGHNRKRKRPPKN